MCAFLYIIIVLILSHLHVVVFFNTNFPLREDTIVWMSFPGV